MENTLIREKVYEVEFDQLENKEITKLNNEKSVLNAGLDLVATLGSCQKTINDILQFKCGDVFAVDKMIDDDMDIKINGNLAAKGECIIIDNKVGVKITKFIER